jgi:hypothetical protein
MLSAELQGNEYSSGQRGEQAPSGLSQEGRHMKEVREMRERRIFKNTRQKIETREVREVGEER